tara:strand:- start:13 stop:411 length:399 start_codon:yes stop_codon:yes gene_type:complete
MVLTDTIADMLATIKNGLLVKKETVQTPFSNMKSNILKIFVDEGYIKSYKTIKEKNGLKKIDIILSYTAGKPSIKKLSRVSKPGRRMYTKLKNLPSYYKGYGTTIISTSKGVMTDKEARKSNIGGEILCQIF